MKVVLRYLALLVAFVPLVAAAQPAENAQTTSVPIDLYLVSQEDVESAELALSMAWSHVGCIQLGTRCYDVFDDGTGTLWVCKACFTTKRPNSGKCRQLTAWELANSAWCA